MSGTRAKAFAVTLVFGLVSLVPLALEPDGRLWERFEPADCTEYCEGSHRCGDHAERPAIQQPLNTISNLAYLFVGLLVVFRRRDAAGLSFGAAMALLCIGSGWFHASMTREGQWLDVVAMYASLNVLVGLALEVNGTVAFRRSLPAFLLLDVVLGVFKWRLPTIPILAAQGLVALTVLVRRARAGALPWVFVFGPPLVFFTGYALHAMDRARIGCDPAGWLYQGHAVWHCTSAIFLWGTFLALEKARLEQPAGADA